MPSKNDFWITVCSERSRPLSLPLAEIIESWPYLQGSRTEVTFLPGVRTCSGTLMALAKLAALPHPALPTLGWTPPHLLPCKGHEEASVDAADQGTPSISVQTSTPTTARLATPCCPPAPALNIHRYWASGKCETIGWIPPSASPVSGTDTGISLQGLIASKAVRMNGLFHWLETCLRPGLPLRNPSCPLQHHVLDLMDKNDPGNC